MVALICEQGDIVSINFDPSKRHEPAGRHYAIVLSPWEINRMSTLTTLVPVTSTDNGYPLHVRIAEGNPIHGFIQCEAIRAIDLGVREQQGAVEVVGALDDGTLAETLARVLVVLGVEPI
ncbi:type II toxin-antitoxin system PemK/MazF family toxin [Eggerthella sp. YY7918]|uniref:type II toxin-antitoxin system PemK/MazF family toxin n=1 Tax=Eggerthella sp. (strain YY7918) TaxID=502558 RepID=UPI0012447340|nr:type II toxin-antitoxin system PemK/MazF family toxin [Eggerthella sp. YY7918]